MIAMPTAYARVSTNHRETAARAVTLNVAGCVRSYCKKACETRWDRPELHRLLGRIRKGDVLAVWKLDRLSRSLRDVLTILNAWRKLRLVSAAGPKRPAPRHRRAG
jgi:DNA invertase Pin-like site-specific DNA recombinase